MSWYGLGSPIICADVDDEDSDIRLGGDEPLLQLEEQLPAVVAAHASVYNVHLAIVLRIVSPWYEHK